MPFAGYETFQDCVQDNQSKENPEAYCGSLEAAMKGSYTILKQESPRQYTLGVVYEPDVKDAHNDFMRAEDIEAAAHAYMRKLQGRDEVSKTAHDLLEAIVKAVDDDITLRVDVGNLLDVKKHGVNDMHQNTPFDDDLGEVVESFVAPTDMEVNGQHVRKGSWLVGVVWNSEMFQKIQSGERTGYSLEGRGMRV